jgi:hypothetical protein
VGEVGIWGHKEYDTHRVVGRLVVSDVWGVISANMRGRRESWSVTFRVRKMSIRKGIDNRTV